MKNNQNLSKCHPNNEPQHLISTYNIIHINRNRRIQSNSSDSSFSTSESNNKIRDDFILLKNTFQCALFSKGSPEKNKTKQLFVSSNHYALPITMDDETGHENLTQNPSMEREKRIPLPPPIVVRGVKDFMTAELFYIADPKNFSNKSTINSLKI